MHHPTDGALRRMLDEPDGVPVTDRDHLDSCDRCRDALVGIRDDAELVHVQCPFDFSAASSRG